jgi:hypothetical protein
MPDTKDVTKLLEEAIRKRDELNTFIKVLQEMSGASPSMPEPVSVGSQQQPFTPGQEVADPLTAVYPGMFFGKSQTTAVKMLLERVHRPLKTAEVIECLKKGGVEIGGSKPSRNLWGILNRASDTFILVPKAGWGLMDWYEASVIAKYRKEEQKENGGTEEEKTDKPKS